MYDTYNVATNCGNVSFDLRDGALVQRGCERSEGRDEDNESREVNHRDELVDTRDL